MSDGPVRMRFEVAAAWAIGVLLPLLETARRGFGHWAIDSTTMLEDYLAGAFLVWAAVASRRRLAGAGALLLTAWAAVTGMMTLSFISQVEDSVRGVDLEPRNEVVLVFKLLLWVTCMAALVRSFRAVRAPASS
jgi:hypothetical protein